MKKLLLAACVTISALAAFPRTNHCSLIVHKSPDGSLQKMMMFGKASAVSVSCGTNTVPYAVYDITLVNGRPVATNLVTSTLGAIR